MSGYRFVFTAHFDLIFLCVLHLCSSNTLNGGRQRRYTEEDVCLESQKSLQEVKSCPDNSVTFDERSTKKNCSEYKRCAGHQLIYHCVFDETRERLVEVCAPLSFITGRCCASYNMGLGRVIEDWKKPCSRCPFQYPSNYFNNSECVLKRKNNEDMEKHDYQILIYIIVPVILIVGFFLVIACFCRKTPYKALKRVCCTLEDGLKNIKEKQDLFKPLCHELVCHEGRKAMNTDKSTSLQNVDFSTS